MTMAHRHALLFLAGAMPTAARAQEAPLPRPPGVRVVTISRPEHRGAEPAIALDPNTPSHLIGGYGGPYIAYSTDSGRTFTLADGTVPSNGRGGGDVTVAYDDAGAAYLSYLTSEGLGTASYWAHNAGASAIWVQRSADGGRTWDTPPVLVKKWPNPIDTAPQMVDMSRIWTDASPRSPYHGNLYVGWINWELDKSIMQFSRSTDHGRTWSRPMRISTKAGLPRDDNGGLVGITAAVAPDGTMYVIWNDLNSIVFTTSRDGGRSFTPSRSVVAVGPPYFGGATGVPGIRRVMGFPQIGFDARHGVLYVTWSDYRNGDVDVFLSRSTDKGNTWSPAQRLGDDRMHNGKDQFFQWLAVDPVNGDVYVQYYDRRQAPAKLSTSVTLARSTDRGRTFTYYGWSDEPFDGQNVFLGDYSWLVARDGRAYGIWIEAIPEGAPGGSLSGNPPRSGTIVKVGSADFRKVAGSS